VVLPLGAILLLKKEKKIGFFSPEIVMEWLIFWGVALLWRSTVWSVELHTALVGCAQLKAHNADFAHSW